MPFRETDRMHEREALVQAWKSGLYSKSELGRRFEVTRPTVDLWIHRDEQNEPYSDRSRAPQRSPHRTERLVTEQLIACRRQHPDWGPKKIGDLLRRREPSIRWPADSTIGDILKRAGLIEPRVRRPRSLRPEQRQRPAWSVEPGRTMTADFKGDFFLGNRRRCYPLTIVDPVSRFIYAIDATTNTSFEFAQPVFERVFRMHGMPDVVVTDNGPPFCTSIGAIHLTRLGVWCLKYDIDLRHTRPGHPEDNAAHERMHRSLKAATLRPPGHTFADQQTSFDRFRREFNHDRSHEGIGRRVPAQLHRPSPRPFPRRLHQPSYPGHFEIRKVSTTGTFSWRGAQIFLSASLAAEQIGLEEVGDAIWSVRFFKKELARFDERTKIVV